MPRPAGPVPIVTPDGSVVISGDTRVCEEVFALASDAESEKFESDVRAGGYEGPVTVGRDLTTMTIGA